MLAVTSFPVVAIALGVSVSVSASAANASGTGSKDPWVAAETMALG
ncbi:hypothetical protein [Streptococcus iniae]|nr:hypothetical protein [Streptococcus iniae]